MSKPVTGLTETLFFPSVERYKFKTWPLREESRKLSNSKKEDRWGVIKVATPQLAGSRAWELISLETFPTPVSKEATASPTFCAPEHLRHPVPRAR